MNGSTDAPAHATTGVVTPNAIAANTARSTPTVSGLLAGILNECSG